MAHVILSRISSHSSHLIRISCGICILILSVEGQTVTLNGPSYAVQGNSTQFTCILNGSSTGLGLVFMRGTSSSTYTACTVNTRTCKEHKSEDGYSCACVSGETRVFYLNIKSVSLQDDADWRCFYNGQSSNISLDVYYPPAITSVPSNKDVTENTSPNIDCSSNITPGNPPLTSYRWTGPSGYSKTGFVLDRTVTRTQGGQYTCTATSTAGLLDTATVNVNVKYSPTIASVPSNKDVTENTTPNIDCSSNITPGNPSSTNYRWTGPGGYSKTGPALDRTVTRTQGGQYTCTATNSVGSDRATVIINVQYPPTITSVPSNMNVTENTSPNIDCSSNITPGNPSSTSYRWTGPRDYNKTEAVLDRTVTRTQAGQYTCTATNTAGLSDISTVSIDVQYAPAISSIPKDKFIDENTKPSIDCSSNITPGNPPSTKYRWTGPGGYSKSGAVLDRNITSSDKGQYTCTATNTAGLSDTAQVNINVISPPLSPTKFDVALKKDTFTLFKWTSNFNGGAGQLFYVEYQDGGSHIKTQNIADPGIDKVVTWNISKLEPNTQYAFTLFSENPYGRSDPVMVNTTTAKSPTENIDELCGGCGLCRGLGIGFGICLPVIIGLIGGIVVFHRQISTLKQNKESAERDKNQSDGHANIDSSIGDGAYSVLAHDSSSRTLYEKIQMEPKEAPGEYENMNTDKPKSKSGIYENQQGLGATDVDLYENQL